MAMYFSFNHARFSDTLLSSSIERILRENELLALASLQDSLSYINTAYYCFNDKLELFILTEPFKEHSKNIAANPSVAAAIYDSHQRWDTQKRGLQLFGTCDLAMKDVFNEAYSLYVQRFPGLVKWAPTPDAILAGAIQSRFYRITPTRLKVFDEENIAADEFIPLDLERK